MTRIIHYEIKESEAGLRVEQYLKRRGYSSQNIASIKRMPESILVNGIHYYMRQPLSAGDRLTVQITETRCSEKIPPVNLPLDIVYEDEDIIVINKPAGADQMLGNNSQAGGIPVQTVTAAENKRLVLFLVIPVKCVCHSIIVVVERRMNRHSGRLVNDNNIFILIDDI